MRFGFTVVYLDFNLRLKKNCWIRKVVSFVGLWFPQWRKWNFSHLYKYKTFQTRVFILTASTCRKDRRQMSSIFVDFFFFVATRITTYAIIRKISHRKLTVSRQQTQNNSRMYNERDILQKNILKYFIMIVCINSNHLIADLGALYTIWMSCHIFEFQKIRLPCYRSP